MMGRLLGRGQGQQGPSYERSLEEDRRSTEHSTALSVASGQAQPMMEAAGMSAEEFMDSLNSPDLDRSYPDEDPKQLNLEELLAAELSQQIAISDIPEQKADEEEIMDRARALLTKMEFARPASVGSKCQGDTRRRITGNGDEYKELNDDLDREIDAAFEVVGYMRRGSVGGKRFRGVVDTTVVTKSEGWSPNERSKGRIGRLTDWITGG